MRQHHTFHHLEVGHSQRIGRFDLASTDGLDTRPKYLGHISTVVDAESDDSCRNSTQNDSQLRQTEIDHEYLNDQRCAPYDRDIKSRYAIKIGFFESLPKAPNSAKIHADAIERIET